MKHRIQVTCLLMGFSLWAFGAPGFTVRSRAPQDKEETRDFKIFTNRVQAYVKMQKNLEDSLSTLRPTKDAEQIIEHQHAPAGKIADARRDARQGESFTHEVAERFRKIIHSAFHGTEGRSAREATRQDDPSRVIVLPHVNDVFPEGVSLTTTPPSLLLKLPELPRELAYRFVGCDLTLIDIKARLIADLIPNHIP
jgi:hypothetical protein